MGNFANLAVRASFFLFGKLIFVGKPFQSLISDFQKKTLLNSMGTPPKFNSSPLKNGGWKTILSYWEGNLSGAMSELAQNLWIDSQQNAIDLLLG